MEEELHAFVRKKDDLRNFKKILFITYSLRISYDKKLSEYFKKRSRKNSQNKIFLSFVA